MCRIASISHVALPNLLSKTPLVPEYLQDDATPEALGEAVLSRLESTEERDRLHQAFCDLHEALRCDADEQAAAAISELIEERR